MMGLITSHRIRPLDSKKLCNRLLCKILMFDYKKKAVRKECYYISTGKVIYDEFNPSILSPLKLWI